MQMNSLTFWAAVTILAASASWTHAQQPPSANALVVEASRLIVSADSAPRPEQAIALLEEARRKLLLITEVHPSSDLAVKLATGQGIGSVSLAGVQTAIEAATERCWTSLSLICVARLTLDAARSPRAGPFRVYAFVAVAAAQMKAGASEDMQATFQIATNAALTEDGFARNYDLSRIAAAQAAAGQFSAAIKTTELIKSVYWRIEPLLALAAAQRKAGQAEEARDLLDKVVTLAAAVEDADDRASSFSRIASAQAEAGQFSAAIGTAAAIAKATRRTGALLAIATTQTQAGNVDDTQTTIQRAADAARTIRDPYDRARALSDVAGAYIDIGDGERARGTIDQAVAATQASPPVAGDAVSTLTAIAWTQTQAGQIAAAQQTLATAFAAAQAIEDVGARFWRYHAIATVQVQAGSAQAVRSTVATLRKDLKLLEDRSDRDSYLSVVVSIQVKAAQFPEAIETAKLIGDPSERITSLAEIALAQAQDGQVEAARVTISLATEASKSSGSVRAYCLALLAEAQVEAGLVGDAKSTLREALRAAEPMRDLFDLRHIFGVLSEMHDAALL